MLLTKSFLFAAACHVCTKEFKFNEDSYEIDDFDMCSLDCVQCYYEDSYNWGELAYSEGVERYQCNVCDDWLELGGKETADFFAHACVCPDCYHKAW